MFKSLRSAVVLGCLGAAFIACTAGVGAGSIGSSQPTEQAQITAPASGLQITASISSVTLGDECGGGEGFAPSADCAPSEAPADGGSGSGAKRAPGGCGGSSYCQQSNVQLSFTASAGNASTS